MEDDVITTRGFISEIIKYSNDGTDLKAKWFMIEFSDLGFIGKFFHNRDLPLFISMFTTFALYQPVDYLYYGVLQTISCDPAKDEVKIFFLK